MPCARRNLILACLIFLLLAVPALQAQQGGVGSVVGELHLSKGDFAGRIFVELQLRGATLGSAYSDEEGRFGFYGLGSNPYHVVINDERFYPVDQLVVLDTSIYTVAMAQINLIPREPAKKEPLPNREPGSNPNLVDPAEYRRHFPKNAVKEFDKGVAADKHQISDEAIRHYEKAISLAPDFYPAHNNLGSDYLSKADYAGAEKQFKEVLRVNQNDSQAYFNLGHVLTLTNRFEEAEKALQQGLQKQPDSAFGHFLLGSLYSRTGRGSEAERNLNDALQLDPAMPQAYLQLVNLYLQQRRSKDAASELKTYLKLFPNDGFAPKAKGVLERLEGKTAEGASHN
ncbi:MAG: tetratricopeptide repeat protein [Acidobacteriia bacterium]|nr:tetratricopeptide repeat protein [Terriglobia bacterium]